MPFLDMRLPAGIQRRGPAALALLALAGSSCSQVEERPQPVQVDPCAHYEALAVDVLHCLESGEFERALTLLAQLPPLPPEGHSDPRERELLGKLHVLAEQAHILLEFQRLDLEVKGEAIMDESIVPPFESRPRA